MMRITTKTVTVYCTSDGYEFLSPAEAARHERKLFEAIPLDDVITFLNYIEKKRGEFVSPAKSKPLSRD